MVPDEFERVGRDLHDAFLVSTRGGNLSVRLGTRILITRTGASLGHLGAGDVVEIELDGPAAAAASSDQDVHRALYRSTGARAIVHAHPTAVVALSIDAGDAIEPEDHEGRIFVPTVPVVDEREPRAALGAAAGAATAGGARLAVARGHGSYAVGDTLVDALAWTTTLEQSARIALLRRRV